jgi:hypothetical protein
MAKRGTDENAIQEHLKSSLQNQTRDYHIGAAFMRGQEGSMRLGHAIVILQNYNLQDTQPTPFKSEIKVDITECEFLRGIKFHSCSKLG